MAIGRVEGATRNQTGVDSRTIRKSTRSATDSAPCAPSAVSRHAGASRLGALSSNAWPVSVRTFSTPQSSRIDSVDMGKHQREKARAKRAAFKANTQPVPSTSTPVHSSAFAALSSTAATSHSSSSPHHVDLLRLAFLEWLLPLKRLTSPHELWDRFMADWSAIPAHELPVQSSRPATLFSHVRALRNSNNMGAMRREVKKGRAKVARAAADDEGGLKPHQSLLHWYLEGGEGGKQSEVAFDTSLDHGVKEEGEERTEEGEVRVAAAKGVCGKRKRSTETHSSERDNDAASKRRSGTAQQSAASTLPLAGSNNIWAALADG